MGAAGSLTCVGLGMLLGAHISPRARSHLEQADVVFVLASDSLTELWVQSLHADVRSLQPCYGEGRSRHDSYRDMVALMLDEVRAGRRVCGAFYGHPGVFAKVPHEAIATARGEGFEARMEPGISAEACLYADLAIDPGRVGCQHYEASQFLLYRRTIDPSAYLVLWQVAITGDRSLRRSATPAPYRQLLVERLLQDYAVDQRGIVYEAATLPIHSPRCEDIALTDLPQVALSLKSTLVLPPCRPPQPDSILQARIAELDRIHAAVPSTNPLGAI